MNKKRIQWAAAVMAAAIMVLIFFFSAQSAQESDFLSKGIGKMLLEWFPSLSSMVTLSELNHCLRKMAHFVIYLALGICLTLASGRQRKLPPVVLSILIGAVFAASDEVHQIFSDGRGAMIQDVFLDTFGVAVGSCLIALCEKAHRMRGQKN